RQGGPWRAGPRTRAVAVFGDSTVDLREAISDGEVIEVSAVAVFGDVHIIVAPGSRVEMSGLALFGDKRSEVADAGSATGPLVRVKALAMFGDVKVR
ncbi:MAG: DUF1707 SHOCT-like domain-containing protein, partial [Acidimicrobiales bacterium]